MSPVPIYTPGWRETKCSKVPYLRKQRDGRGLNPGPPDLEFEFLATPPHTLPQKPLNGCKSLASYLSKSYLHVSQSWHKTTKYPSSFSSLPFPATFLLRVQTIIMNQAPVVRKLDNGLHPIKWIMQLVSLILIRWIVIYPVESATQRLTNRGHNTRHKSLKHKPFLLNFLENFLHSLFTPFFSLKCAPLLPRCWATRILKHWDDCNT